MNYKAPVAEIVNFETVDVIAASIGESDTPDKMNTWGKSISEYASEDYNLFG